MGWVRALCPLPREAVPAGTGGAAPCAAPRCVLALPPQEQRRQRALLKPGLVVPLFGVQLYLLSNVLVKTAWIEYGEGEQG